MYENFFGLKTKPFALTPDPESLFITDNYRKVLASLNYGIHERVGFLSLSGERGVGKKTLLQHAQKLRSEKTKTLHLPKTPVTYKDLLKEILLGLKVSIGEESVDPMIRQLKNHLLQLFERGGNLAIFIEEAQNLGRPVFEQLSSLSYLEAGKGSLLQVVLVGQPEMEMILELGEFRHLKQRIGIRRKLQPLSEDETRRYIEESLQKAGGNQADVFNQEAIDFIVQNTGGIFREINILCDKTFWTAYGQQKNRIDVPTVREALARMKFSRAEEISPASKRDSVKKAMSAAARDFPKAVEGSTSRSMKFPLKWRRMPLFAAGVLAFILIIYQRGDLLTIPRENEAIKIGGLSAGRPDKPGLPMHERGIAPSSPGLQASVIHEEKESFRSPVSKGDKSPSRTPPSQEKKPRDIETPGEAVRFIGEPRMIKGGTLYSLSKEYYQEANPTLIDHILISNPAITDIHHVPANLKIRVPEIREESLLFQSSNGSWKVHLGTFVNMETARRYKDESLLKGKEIELIERRVSPETSWQRVIAHSFESKEEGLKTIQELSKKGLLPALKRK